MAFDYDFSGYATKNDILCTDGRIIRAGAFAGQDGEIVPLVWNHDHRNMENIVGMAMLKNRPDGVYAYGSFNDTPKGKNAKALVEHGDIRAISIFANQLKQDGPNVMHGIIRELSLVYAGANPEAYIDSVLKHEDGSDEEAIIYFGEEVDISHGSIEDKVKTLPDQPKESTADNKEVKGELKDETVEDFFAKLTEKKRAVAEFLITTALKGDNVSHSDDETDETANAGIDNGETVADIWATFTPYEAKVVKALIGAAIKAKEEKQPEEGKPEDNKEEVTMKHNAFDTGMDRDPEEGILTHEDQENIIKMAKKPGCGSLRAAMADYQSTQDHLAHGIDGIESLFPDYKDVKPGAPELLTDELAWVSTVMNGVHKSPVSRIRTRQVDARGRKFRGKGYKKGDLKKEGGNAKLLTRTTDPCTVYVKDSIHHDDIIDITDFDVVSYMYNMQRAGLNEEIATAMLFGDGREEGDEDKIPEDKIRPIWTDDELFTIHKTVDIEGMKTKLQGSDTSKRFGDNFVATEAMIEANLDARIDYKGSGSPIMFATPQMINTMLMARDLNGRRIYNGVDELKSILNVSSIVTVEQMNGLTRENTDGNTMEVLALIVNLNDYYLGATKGGEITQFNQFDIDFNKEKFLLETRCSGALVKVKSAIVLEKKVS